MCRSAVTAGEAAAEPQVHLWNPPDVPGHARSANLHWGARLLAAALDVVRVANSLALRPLLVGLRSRRDLPLLRVCIHVHDPLG